MIENFSDIVINITQLSNNTNTSFSIPSFSNCVIEYHPVNEFALILLVVILVFIIFNKIMSKWIYGIDMEGIIVAVVIFIFAIVSELNYSITKIILCFCLIVFLLIIDYIFG